MKQAKWVPVLLLTAALGSAPSVWAASEGAPEASVNAHEGEISRWGAIRLLTYNVAGLYDLVSESRPSVNHRAIGNRLNDFDLALVQESFHYHRRLRAGTFHPHVTRGSRDLWPVTEGDGLSRFSFLPMGPLRRESWLSCSGFLSGYSDCLASKGVTLSTVRLSPGVEVDVYNVHMDAGDEPSDVAARASQVEQLAKLIERASGSSAVIVTGDTNIDVRNPSDAENLDRLREVGLDDACAGLMCEGLIDKILYRSGGGVALIVSEAWVPEDFLDEQGGPLSDHDPLAAVMLWEAVVDSQTYADSEEGGLFETSPLHQIGSARFTRRVNGLGARTLLQSARDSVQTRIADLGISQGQVLTLAARKAAFEGLLGSGAIGGMMGGQLSSVGRWYIETTVEAKRALEHGVERARSLTD